MMVKLDTKAELDISGSHLVTYLKDHVVKTLYPDTLSIIR